MCECFLCLPPGLLEAVSDFQLFVQIWAELQRAPQELNYSCSCIADCCVIIFYTNCTFSCVLVIINLILEVE